MTNRKKKKIRDGQESGVRRPSNTHSGIHIVDTLERKSDAENPTNRPVRRIKETYAGH